MEHQFLFNIHRNVDQDFINSFRNINFVCLHGSKNRALQFAKLYLKSLNNQVDSVSDDLFLNSDFCCYKVDNLLSISHGMGDDSISLLLNDIMILLNLAQNKDLHFFRLGTSGGIGVEIGSVIVSEEVYTPDLKERYLFDKSFKEFLLKNKEYCNIYFGGTISADDFYLSQARFDGALKVNYTKEERDIYFNTLKDRHIRNFEMEGVALARFLAQFNYKISLITTTLVDRLVSDSVKVTEDEIAQFVRHTAKIVIDFLRRKDKH